MDRTNYVYLRALEWEGSWPNDAGAWARTVSRIGFGEGMMLPSEPQGMVELDGDALPACPKIDRAVLDPRRAAFYIPVHSSKHASRVLATKLATIQIGIHLNQSWGDPSGQITYPSTSDSLFPDTHSVALRESIRFDTKFRFSNWWAGWGDADGMGVMPVEYFDTYGFEGNTYLPHQIVKRLSSTRHGGFTKLIWTVDKFAGATYFLIELRDASDARVAWMMASEIASTLEVYELFVMPEHRREGLASHLIDTFMAHLVLGSKQLMLTVPYSDSEESSHGTFPALGALARKIDVKFVQPESAFHCYVAGRDFAGASVPVRYTALPTRPRSTAVMSEQTDVSEQLEQQTDWPSADSEQSVLARRQELARKKATTGLNAAERFEFNRLQEKEYRRLRSQLPESNIADEVDALERKLGNRSSDKTEN